MIDFSDKIWVLDGAMATMLPVYDSVSENSEKGCCDSVELNKYPSLYCIAKPQLVEQVHLDYLAAGADIISTNSFNLNFPESNLSGEEIALKSVAIAKSAITKYCAENDSERKYVAGNIGALCLSECCSDEVFYNYYQHSKWLLIAGVDMLLLETMTSVQESVVAMNAVKQSMDELKKKVPVMLSFTLTREGTTYAGERIGDILQATEKELISSIGLNCGYGVEHLLPLVEELASMTDLPVSFHPNAGVSDDYGHYASMEKQFARKLESLMKSGMINVVGGCCGTTPGHIKEIADMARLYSPRKNKN